MDRGQQRFRGREVTPRLQLVFSVISGFVFLRLEDFAEDFVRNVVAGFVILILFRVSCVRCDF